MIATHQVEEEILELVDLAGEVSRSDLQGMVTALAAKLTADDPDQVSVSWHIEDVQEVDDSLSDEQARAVLRYAKRKHDATIGINWEVLQYHIDYLREQGEI